MNENIYKNTYEKNQKKSMVLIIISLLVVAIGLGIPGAIFYTKEVRAPIITKYNEIMVFQNTKDKIVQIKTDEYFSTGYYEHIDGKKVAWYYMVRLNDASGLVSFKSTKEILELDPTVVRTFKGVISRDPYRKDNLEVLTDYYEVAYEDAITYLLDFEINDKYEREYLYLAVIGLLGLIATATFYFGNYKTNVKNRKTLESFCEVDVADDRFSQEFASSNKIERGKFALTKNWLFSSMVSNTFLIPASEVVWCYKIITTQRTNGIKTGTTYSANFCLSDGSTKAFSGGRISEFDIDNLIDFVVENWPKTDAGFSEERRIAWTSNKDEVIAAFKKK